jgi:hypothetical protein
VRDSGENAVAFEIRPRMDLSAQQPGSATAVAPVPPVIAPVVPPVAAIIAAILAPVMTPHGAKYGGSIASLSEQPHRHAPFIAA